MLISDGLRDKYKLKNGETITLDKEYSSDSYKIKVSGVCTYPAALAVFMNEKTYREMFDVEEGYFSGYFSNEKLTDIDEKLIATVVTEEDLTKVSRQLDRSMGQMFYRSGKLPSISLHPCSLFPQAFSKRTDNPQAYCPAFHPDSVLKVATSSFRTSAKRSQMLLQ